MAQQTIGVGTSANDGTGDSFRGAFQKVNSNFTELYARPVIERKDLAGLSTYTFSGSSIANFDTLELEIIGRTSDTGTLIALNVRVNGLTTSIYDNQRVIHQNATSTASEALSASSWTDAAFLPGTAVTDTAVPGHMTCTLVGCKSTAFYKQMHSIARVQNSTSTGNSYLVVANGTARTSSAISSVTVFLAAGNFASGSYAILRGVS